MGYVSARASCRAYYERRVVRITTEYRRYLRERRIERIIASVSSLARGRPPRTPLSLPRASASARSRGAAFELALAGNHFAKRFSLEFLSGSIAQPVGQ